MIEQTARVIRVRNGRAELEIRQEGGCASCSMRDGCGMGSLGKLFGERRRRLTIPAEGRRASDRILLGLPEHQLVGAGLILYLTPLLGLLLFALAGNFLSQGSDGWTSLAGLAGLGLGLSLARRLARRRQARPRLLRRL